MKDSFIFYRSFSEAIDDLPDKVQLQLYRAIKEYALNEVEIELTGIAKNFFRLIKPNIAANNRRYENGTKGGRPPEKKEPTDNQGVTEGKPTKNQQITKHEPNNNQEIQEELSEKKPNSNGDENINLNENGNGNTPEIPPPLSKIKKIIARHGYHLDDNSALTALVCQLDPAWLDCQYSFIDFVAETVQADYGGKPSRERHKVFRKLLFSAPNLRDEYPGWKTGKEKQYRATAEKEARRNRPTVCHKCGGKVGIHSMNDLLCQDCQDTVFVFNHETLTWDKREPEPYARPELITKEVG